jgi:hypothetical protein
MRTTITPRLACFFRCLLCFVALFVRCADSEVHCLLGVTVCWVVYLPRSLSLSLSPSRSVQLGFIAEPLVAAAIMKLSGLSGLSGPNQLQLASMDILEASMSAVGAGAGEVDPLMSQRGVGVHVETLLLAALLETRSHSPSLEDALLRWTGMRLKDVKATRVETDGAAALPDAVRRKIPVLAKFQFKANRIIRDDANAGAGGHAGAAARPALPHDDAPR